MKSFTLGFAVILLMLAGAAFAYPSLLGPTGGANLPVAGVIGKGKIALAADYYQTSETIVNENAQTKTTSEFSNTYPMRLLYGLTENIEVGVRFDSQDLETTTLDKTVSNTSKSNSSFNTWSVFAKYLLPVEPFGFAIAPGAVYSDIADTEQTFWQLFLVGSRVLYDNSARGTVLRGSLGANYTREDSGSAAKNPSAFRGYLDLDLTLANKLNITGEYQTKDTDLDVDPLTTLVVRYPLSNVISVELGTTNAGRGGLKMSSEHNLFAGVNCTFGGQ